MLDALRDTHAAPNGSTPVANDRRGILEEIIRSTSLYQTLGFNVTIVTSAKNSTESLALLKKMGLPFST